MSRPPALHVVAPDEAAETVSERVRRLSAEARKAASEHVQALADKLAELQALASEIEAGSDSYSQGARAVARDVARDCESRGLTLRAVMERRP